MKAERIAEIQADLKQSEKLLQPTPLESSMESAVRDLLAERTKLLARIKSARPIFIEHIRQCVNGGSRTCYLCKDTNAWLAEDSE